jgi:hypothetical protein
MNQTATPSGEETYVFHSGLPLPAPNHSCPVLRRNPAARWAADRENIVAKSPPQSRPFSKRQMYQWMPWVQFIGVLAFLLVQVGSNDQMSRLLLRDCAVRIDWPLFRR